MENWYEAGILGVMYMGVKSSFFPCIMFLAVGAMTDFGPLIANPISLLMGAGAQFGIYIAFMVANAITIGGEHLFTPQQAAAIGVIGGADGPTAVFVTGVNEEGRAVTDILACRDNGTLTNAALGSTTGLSGVIYPYRQLQPRILTATALWRSPLRRSCRR